jgi:hypothetical protein
MANNMQFLFGFPLRFQAHGVSSTVFYRKTIYIKLTRHVPLFLAFFSIPINLITDHIITKFHTTERCNDAHLMCHVPVFQDFLYTSVS